MTKEEAVEGSIRKWEGIVAGTEKDWGGDNCALCKYQIEVEKDDFNCLGCPVKDLTGQSNCDGTPYEKWNKHHLGTHGGAGHMGGKIECRWCRKYAEDEVEFLKDLYNKIVDERISKIAVVSDPTDAKGMPWVKMTSVYHLLFKGR